MGGLGSDAAIEAADIVIMDDGIEKVPLAVRIARRTVRIAWQNIIFALAVKLATLLAYIGAAAAYMHGAEWLEQMLDYIKGNIDFTENYLKEYIPGISMIRPQASYLVFLDCRALGLAQEALTRLFAEKAHLALNDGTMFGVPGEGFMRLNIGCPRSMLEQALKQLRDAVVQ